jgi:ABC-type amino acid transport substrate-binding protein
MKNQLLTLAFLLTLGPLVSCTPHTNAAPPSGTSTLSEIQKRGELRIGYHVEPPTIVKDPVTGELGGSFIHAIRQIAAGMHVKPVFVEVDLGNFVAGLQNHLYDVSLGPTFKTIPRAQAVAFTNSIYYLGYTGVVRKGAAAKYREEAMIDAPGVRVAVKSGSPIEQYVRDNFKKATIVAIDGADLSVPLQAVSAGKAEVGLMNEHTVEFYVRDHPDVEPVLTDHPLLMAGMGWTVLHGDPDWLSFLNTSLEVLISTGQLANWERETYSGKSLRRTAPELWGSLRKPFVP